MKKLLLITVLLLAVFISCTKGTESKSNSNTGNSNNVCTGTQSFATDVNPIIQSVCANSGCHDAASFNGPGPLTNYQQVFNARAAIRSAVASGVMPKNTTLSSSQKNAILCWIDNGAGDN